MQGTRQGFEPVSPARIGFDHLVGTQIPASQKMTDTPKIDSHSVEPVGYGGCCQCPILPLKIIFRGANKFKDPLDWTINVRTRMNADHFVCSFLIMDRDFPLPICVHASSIIGIDPSSFSDIPVQRSIHHRASSESCRA